MHLFTHHASRITGERVRSHHVSRVTWLLLAGLTLLLGCRPNLGDALYRMGRRVTIHADGRQIPLSTTVLTVREALAEAGVTVGPDDRVQPDLWVELQDGMAIRVVRVQEEVIVEREVLPYAQQTIKSEALPVGERKLLQAGKNGEVEVTYRLHFQDGVEAGRSVLQQVVVREAVSQIIAVGVAGVVESVEIQGAIAYLNSGNAWMMRGASGGRYAVTSAGNLDGQVFALSPDGAYLLYSVPTDTVAFDGAFNELYLLNVALVGEKPQRLPIQNVLWAGWSPDARRIAYSRGVKSGPPGWKANNDLWLALLRNDQGDLMRPDPERVLGPQTAGAYSWWGTDYAWSPDGTKLAYARPDQVGWVDLRMRRVFPLADFTPLNARSDWVWSPTLSWSPDSKFVASVIHGQPQPGQQAEDSQRFELWAFSLTPEVRARLVDPVGMWGMPRWSPVREDGQNWIAYAQADDPFNSQQNPYVLKVMDRDGSNKRVLFPAAGERGLWPPIAYDWSPDGEQIAVLYLGDLYLVDLASEQTYQLTGDGQSTGLDWAE